jgi:hypothetical protein
MAQDDLPAIMLTRVQQVYAILASVADAPQPVANNKGGHLDEGVPSALEYASEANADISAGHDGMSCEKEPASSKIAQA